MPFMRFLHGDAYHCIGTSSVPHWLIINLVSLSTDEEKCLAEKKTHIFLLGFFLFSVNWDKPISQIYYKFLFSKQWYL